MVLSGPCVMTTMRGLEELAFGEVAIFLAISARSVVCGIERYLAW